MVGTHRPCCAAPCRMQALLTKLLLWEVIISLTALFLLATARTAGECAVASLLNQVPLVRCLCPTVSIGSRTQRHLQTWRTLLGAIYTWNDKSRHQRAPQQNPCHSIHAPAPRPVSPSSAAPPPPPTYVPTCHLPAGFTATEPSTDVGPNDTALHNTDFSMVHMPFAGVLSIPLLFLSLLTLARKSLLPKIGDEMLRCACLLARPLVHWVSIGPPVPCSL